MRFREREAEGNRLWDEWCDQHVEPIATMLRHNGTQKHIFKAGVHMALRDVPASIHKQRPEEAP